MNRSGLTTRKWLYLALILVLILTGAYLIIRFYSNKNIAIKADVAKVEPVITSELATKPEDTTKPKKEVDLSVLKMPILMYHYIRDYQDESDQVGIGLSVSAQSFATQLDQIIDSGYQTATFKDIANNNIAEKPIILTFDDGYSDFYSSAYPELKKRAMKAVVYIIVSNIGKDGYLSKEQIIELSREGIEIGSHTLSHIDLSKAEDDRSLVQIRDSKLSLEQIISTSVLSFCYPSGKLNAQTPIMIKNNNYKFAVTTKSGIAEFSNPFQLSRYRISNNMSLSKILQ